MSEEKRGSEPPAGGALRTAVCLHGSKETMYEKGEALGLQGEALRNFVYACYEVKIGLVVDSAGNASIETVDGRALEARPAPADQRGEATEDPHTKAFFAVKDGPTLEMVAASPQSLQDARMAILNVLNSLDFINYRLAKDFAYGALKAVYEAIAERAAPRESAPSSLPLDPRACDHEFEFSSDIDEPAMKCDKCGEPLEVVSSIDLRRLRGQEAA